MLMRREVGYPQPSELEIAGGCLTLGQRRPLSPTKRKLSDDDEAKQREKPGVPT